MNPLKFLSGDNLDEDSTPIDDRPEYLNDHFENQEQAHKQKDHKYWKQDDELLQQRNEILFHWDVDGQVNVLLDWDHVVNDLLQILLGSVRVLMRVEELTGSLTRLRFVKSHLLRYRIVIYLLEGYA